MRPGGARRGPRPRGGLLRALLADRFTRHVSVRVMEHAARLDLSTYEDPAFHDKLERARVQATDRIAMIHAIGALLQQGVIVVSLSVSIVYFSPWLLLVLVLAVVPAFLGESHFAFLGYSLNIEQTPDAPAARLPARARREQGNGQGAEAVRSRAVHHRPVRAARRRALRTRTSRSRGAVCWRRLCRSSARAATTPRTRTSIYRTVNGDLSWGRLQFLAGSIAGASSDIQSIFATFSNIADQSLFLTDLVEFFRVQPTIRSKPDAIPAPRPIRDGFVFEDVSFPYPGQPAAGPRSPRTSASRSASASRWSARTARARRRS